MKEFKEDFALYWRLMSFAKPYWRAILVAIFAVLFAAAMEPMMPALMKPLIDESLIAKDPTSLWMIPLGLVLVVLLRGLADYAASYSSAYLSGRTIEDLRGAIFKKELELPLTDHACDSPGRMLTRITYDTEMVADAVSSVWMVVIRDTFVIIGLVAFLFYTAWDLALFVFLTMPILMLAIRWIGKRLRTSSSRLQVHHGQIASFVQEALLGLREIKLFVAHRQQTFEFGKISYQLRREFLKSSRISALAGPIVASLTAITVALVIYFASFVTISGGLTPGEFVAFITALAMVFGPIRRLSAVHVTLQRGLASAEAIFTLLDRPSEASEDQGALRNELGARGLIEFRGISFSYPHQANLALERVSFRVEAGEAVALIGPSGAGKSTVLNLIARFYEPTEGSIYLDGRHYDEWPVSLLRSQISFVGQNVVLFDGTISENIQMGLPKASQDSVIWAARQAHAMEFIDQLPDGINSCLGSMGGRLSGGQRQRIAIARAFLKNAPILMLDEPTSALDRESEAAVIDGIKTLMRGRTVVWVSHSPERLVGIDRVIPIG